MIAPVALAVPVDFSAVNSAGRMTFEIRGGLPFRTLPVGF